MKLILLALISWGIIAFAADDEQPDQPSAPAETGTVNNWPALDLTRTSRSSTHTPHAVQLKDAKDFLELLCASRSDQSVDAKSCAIRNNRFLNYIKFGKAYMALKICAAKDKPDVACFVKAREHLRKKKYLAPQYWIKESEKCKADDGECLQKYFQKSYDGDPIPRKTRTASPSQGPASSPSQDEADR